MNDAPTWVFALLAVLLGLSALCSSTETALFGLTPAQRERAGGAARRLMVEPRAVLITVLLSNLVINLLYFAFVGRLLPGDQGLGDVAVGLGALAMVLVFGEIGPKVVALRAPVPIARFGAPFLAPLVPLLQPLRNTLERALEALHRLSSRWLGPVHKLTPDALSDVLERGAEEGLLLDHEASLLTEIVELQEIRAREIMTPRVDALLLDASAQAPERARIVAAAVDRRQSWLPVVDRSPDRVLGRVRVRDLLLSPDAPLRRMVMPVKFVPEVATALSLLHSLRDDRTNEAVVVDEWGGTAGYVTLEDVFEELVGDLRVEGEERERAAVPLGEGRFRVAGNLSIRDWNDAFGFDVVPTEFETVGGFVTALLGRIPRVGDEARWGDLVLEVYEVRGRRVLAVDLSVEPAGESGGNGGDR